jgi:hypothetical protein
LGTFFHLDGDSQAICGQFGAGFGQLLAVFGGYFWEYFSSIFGALFEVHFCTLFGLRAFCNLLVLRDFLKLDGDLEPFLAPILDVLLSILLSTFGPVDLFGASSSPSRDI